MVLRKRGRLHRPEVAFLLLTNSPEFDSEQSPKFITMLRRFIKGADLMKVDRGLKMLI